MTDETSYVQDWPKNKDSIIRKTLNKSTYYYFDIKSPSTKGYWTRAHMKYNKAARLAMLIDHEVRWCPDQKTYTRMPQNKFKQSKFFPEDLQ